MFCLRGSRAFNPAFAAFLLRTTRQTEGLSNRRGERRGRFGDFRPSVRVAKEQVAYANELVLQQWGRKTVGVRVPELMAAMDATDS